MADDDNWLAEAEYKISKMPQTAKDIRDRAKEDLFFYANLVNKGYMYGPIHKEIFQWLQEYVLFGQGTSQTSNKLIMLPRAHLKSHIVATAVSWLILRHPEITIMYTSATEELAIRQLFAIKNIMDGPIFKRYFPEYIHPREGKRTKWAETKITIDHPARAKEGVRDDTVSIAGLTTNTTGWHADVIIADDLVIPENAYTEDGRERVSKKASQFTSIRNSGGFTLACGTRYHPSDIYSIWKNQFYDEYNDEGELIDKKPVWEIKEYPVEENGIFIWPRVIRSDGKAFGFDKQTLARIKAEYVDRVQFYAQYYNDPNDPASERISRTKFQYYDPRHLRKESGRWYYNNNRLNIYSAVDFAFSLSKDADYTAIVVIGIDSDSNIYVLDIDRFKSNKVYDYFKHIQELHSKWNFNKLRAEVTVAQIVIVEGIKDFIKKSGMTLPVEDYRPSKAEGRKEERIAAALEPKYEDMMVWHHEGGWIPTLEEELLMARPPHDDIKDALASAVCIATPPAKSRGSIVKDFLTSSNRNRFGGFK